MILELAAFAQQRRYDRRPGTGQILPVIATPSERQQPSTTVAFGQLLQTLRRMAVRLLEVRRTLPHCGAR